MDNKADTETLRTHNISFTESACVMGFMTRTHAILTHKHTKIITTVLILKT